MLMLWVLCVWVYLQLLNGGIFFMHFEIVLCVLFSALCSTDNLIQILLIDLIQGSLQIIPQTLHTHTQGKC